MSLDWLFQSSSGSAIFDPPPTAPAGTKKRRIDWTEASGSDVVVDERYDAYAHLSRKELIDKIHGLTVANTQLRQELAAATPRTPTTAIDIAQAIRRSTPDSPEELALWRSYQPHVIPDKSAPWSQSDLAHYNLGVDDEALDGVNARETATNRIKQLLPPHEIALLSSLVVGTTIPMMPIVNVMLAEDAEPARPEPQALFGSLFALLHACFPAIPVARIIPQSLCAMPHYPQQGMGRPNRLDIAKARQIYQAAVTELDGRQNQLAIGWIAIGTDSFLVSFHASKHAIVYTTGQIETLPADDAWVRMLLQPIFSADWTFKVERTFPDAALTPSDGFRISVSIAWKLLSEYENVMLGVNATSLTDADITHSRLGLLLERGINASKTAYEKVRTGGQ